VTSAAWIFLASTVTLAFFCQLYKVRAETLAEEVLHAHDWVDEIIAALEDPDVDQGDRRIVDLCGVRPDGGVAGDLAE